MTIQDQTSRLRRVYVRPPNAGDLARWRDYGWHTRPNAARADEEHAGLRNELERAGVDVLVGTTPVDGDPDAIYAYDPLLMTDRGAIQLRPGKEGRRREPEALVDDLAAAGIPVAGRIEPPGTAEGGDMFWLDRSTLLTGLGYRTNEAGVSQIRALLEPEGVEVLAFDLPHFHGPQECLHLMSFISMLDTDLAVCHVPMMPVRLVELLDRRGVAIVEVPDEELATMGPNVLALAPRVALALEGNEQTRRRMEDAGVEVRTYAGDEISKKGDGGPTCLTRPLVRD